MDERVWAPRVTVATVVYDNERYLMVEEFDQGRRVLNQPAGHLEPGERLPHAAVRETLEETGWEITLEAVLGASLFTNPDTGICYFRTSFLAQPVRHHPEQALDDGIIGAVWLTYAEILERQQDLRSESVMASIQQHRSGRRYDLDYFYPQAL